jgi:hypothetical protein
MNILPFVLAVLLILSYGATASFQSRIASRRNQKAHVGLRKAELSFLRQSEKEHYNGLPGIPVKAVKEKGISAPAKDREPKANEPKFNPICARLNLFPLIDAGRNEHPNLYETSAKLLRTFYLTEKGLEYKILDAIVAAGKRALREEVILPIETLDLNDPELQSIYYTMLKGTKKYTLGKKGSPPLLDYIKIERKESPVCLFDAHPTMLAVFFGSKAALQLHEKLHDGQKQKVDLDELIELTNDPQLALIDPGVWKLLNLNKPTHGTGSRLTLVSEDLETGISLRKDIQLIHK